MRDAETRKVNMTNTKHIKKVTPKKTKKGLLEAQPESGGCVPLGN